MAYQFNQKIIFDSNVVSVTINDYTVTSSGETITFGGGGSYTGVATCVLKNDYILDTVVASEDYGIDISGITTNTFQVEVSDQTDGTITITTKSSGGGLL